MASLAELHTGIKARLATISGLRPFDHPPQGESPPTAFMVLTSWQPATMSRAHVVTYEFEVFVFTAESVRPVDGYRQLMEYADSAGTKSIEKAIWDGNDRPNGTFAGLANTEAHVAEFRVLGAVEIDAFQMYGGVFTVQVRTIP